MLHVYYGDGKGKTTAAMGLALRAAGAGLPVRVVQFLKDGGSHEVVPLVALPGVVYASDGTLAKFTFRMTPEERVASRELHDNRLHDALAAPARGLCVIDEALGALAAGLVDEGLLKEACGLAADNESFDVVLTGREAPAWLLDLADYASEIRAVKHPYERGIQAREGIEY